MLSIETELRVTPPPRVLIQTGKATSLEVVSRHIGKVAEQYGLNYILLRYGAQIFDFRKYYDAVIFVYPFSQTWSVQFFLAFREAKIVYRKKAVFYTLADGRPKTSALPEFVRRELEFVVNSYYSKSKLEEIGVKVTKVVHHGYDPTEIELAYRKAETIRKVLRNRYGDKVIFLYVGDYNIRKGLPELLHAVTKLSQRRKDFVLLLHSPKYVLKYIQNVPNVEWIGEFGSRPHYEIYALYMSVDYVVVPSRCESFGLPVLEANACGKPVIATALPPFLEYAHREANMFVTWTEEKYVDIGEGVLYELRYPDIDELAYTMETAIELIRNYKSQYEDMCVKVREHVKNMTIFNLYRQIIEMIV